MGNMANYEKFRKYFIAALAVLVVFIHVGKYTFLPMESIKFYAWHLMLGLVAVFLYYPFSNKNPKKFLIIDWICIIVTFIIGIYVIANYDNYVVIMQTNRLTPELYIFGFLTTLLVLEASRRVLGYVLPGIAIATILYALFGGNLPGILGHRGYSLQRAVVTIFSDQGVYGTPIAVSATTIYIFLLFGAFLGVSGADEIFRDLSVAFVGKKRGGPAKIAVVSSCLFGSISGSAVANVVSTGAFTIPLMKKLGYSNRFAGAVEAVASTGGQVMPPVMGAAAFILADITRVPYSEVALAALLPALMYYLALFKMIDLESVRLNLAGIPEDELPDVKKTMKKGFKLFVPLIVLLILLIGLKLTPMMAAIWSILALILSSFFDSDDRMNLKKILDGCIDGLKSLPQVVAACACSGIVVGMFSLTGLGLKFSDFIVSLGANSLLLSLVLSMIVCIILGMGLPTTASYIIGATVLSPALIKLGLPTFSANLFIFYFACLSAITPPVAVAAYAAAGIAEENALKVGLTSVKLGITGFFMPYVFIINPKYLHVGFDITTLVTWISAFVVCYSVAIVIAGYIEDKISILERILFAVIAVITIQTSLLLSVIGWILFGFFYGRKAWGHKKIFKTI